MDEGYFWTWVVLLFASAGVFHHSGIKIPYFAFFAHDSGKRCREAPLNMLVAMGLAAALCIGIGSLPDLFYALLPFQAGYKPYTLDHVVAQVQLLFLSALAFTILMRTGIYPPELKSVNIDAEWLYRKLGRRLLLGLHWAAGRAWEMGVLGIASTLSAIVARLQRHHGPGGALARPWPAGTMAFWTTVMLAAYLIFFYL
jgi:multicomponent Na+:H+ antiporter subunit D